METLASWLWSPFLCTIYIELGVLFLFLTRAAAWRGLVELCQSFWNRKGRVEDDTQHEVSHRHAFFASLAATVGVGNLAGVGTAIHLGGPGALFWMWVSALLGMSFRMCSAYWAVELSRRNKNPELFATPMLYIVSLLHSRWSWMATALAGLLMVQGIVSANLIQANSVAHAISGEIGVSNIFVAVVLAGAVGLVVIGGHKTILRFSSIVAPWMIAGYLLAGWAILLFSSAETMSALGDVFYYAFNPYSVLGGVVGYTVVETLQFGISRGIFSHGSGIGIAPFWQGANRDHPSKSAIYAAAVPFVDTLFVCTTTGLVILTAGKWMDTTGAYLTVSSFTHFLGSGGRILVTLCLVVFAYTTIINWAYFGERCFQFLGGKNRNAFRLFFVAMTFIGPFIPLRPLWSLGDLLIGSLLIVHLLPLTYIIIRYNSVMIRDLLSKNDVDDSLI